MNIKSTGIFIIAISFIFAAPGTAICKTLGDGLEKNKKTVIEFYELAINQKNFEAAEKYLGPHYIQHNPSAADGKQGLKNYIKYLGKNMPDYHSEIKRVFAEGNFVILHVHNIPHPGSRGRAIVDIFRLEQGKVVEHWDVIQEIPPESANNNTMF